MFLPVAESTADDRFHARAIVEVPAAWSRWLEALHHQSASIFNVMISALHSLYLTGLFRSKPAMLKPGYKITPHTWLRALSRR